MRDAYMRLASLRPLIGRDCTDLRLYLVLIILADTAGQVGTNARPVSLALLAQLLAATGGHGKAGHSPSSRSIARALLRLEGVPGRRDCPRYLRVVRTVRGGQIFQLEMGRGKYVWRWQAHSQPHTF